MPGVDAPVPVTDFTTPSLAFDFPRLSIGCAEYDEGPTGCTVFVFDQGFVSSVDIRGGMPGVVESEYQFHHAICFAGGSLHGLEAVSGVRAVLTAREAIGNPPPLPLVAGAIIFDWFKRRGFIYPDRALGEAAASVASPGRFFYGRRGAGRWAGVGQGGAFREIGETKIAVFTVVNALGEIVDRKGRVRTGNHRHPCEKLETRLGGPGGSSPDDQVGRHTTLTLVVTNQKWTQGELNQIGRQVHASMARAIQPFHTMRDGDVLFTATTGEVENSPLKSTSDFGLIASELAWDAVLNSLGESA